MQVLLHYVAVLEGEMLSSDSRLLKIMQRFHKTSYTGQFLIDFLSIGSDNTNFLLELSPVLDWRNPQETEIATFYKVRVSDKHWVCQS